MTRPQASFYLLAFGLLLVVSLQSIAQATVVVNALVVRQKVTEFVKAQLAQLVSSADQPYIHIEISQVPAAPFAFPQLTEEKALKLLVSSHMGSLYSERGVVQVSFFNGDTRLREVGVPFQVHIEKPVWVATHLVQANQPLRLSDFELKTRDVSHSYQYSVGSEINLTDYIARTNLQPGDALDSRKILLPPDVSCNNEVRILISNGEGMTLTVPGIALSNGRVGETIRVRQALYTRKYYSARVIDKNRVLVEL